MESSAPQVFSGITPAQYETLIEKAHAAGIEISGNSGTASKYGVVIEWNYSPETLVLTIQCLSAPFFMTTAAIDAKIQALVHQTLAA